MKLRKNIDFWGRLGRACLVVILLAFAYLEKSWIFLFFSVFVFFEVFMSWCVMYQLFGINRCKVPRK